MKIIIKDATNDGIVWCGDHIVLANRLRQGLLDCDIITLPDWHAEADKLNIQNISNDNLAWSSKLEKVFTLKEQNVNSVYAERKALALLRAPAIYKLLGISVHAVASTNTSMSGNIDSDFGYAITASAPEQDQYHYSIIEYAQINGMTSNEAYKQLSLRIENFQNIRCRIYSYCDYFTDKINRASDKITIDAIMAELLKKFISDGQI
jgi:hypothetical protein